MICNFSSAFVLCSDADDRDEVNLILVIAFKRRKFSSWNLDQLLVG
jgi:hypothetical protein